MRYDLLTVTTDTALFRRMGNRIEVLLIKRRGPNEAGKWALPGGHVDPEDCVDLEWAAGRELLEETGISIYQTPFDISLRYAGSREESNPEGKWVGHVYWGLVGPHHDLLDLKAGDDAVAYDWCTLEELRKLEIAFDHQKVLESLFKLASKLARQEASCATTSSPSSE